MFCLYFSREKPFMVLNNHDCCEGWHLNSSDPSPLLRIVPEKEAV